MLCSDPTRESYEREEAIYNKYEFCMEILMFISINVGVIVVFVLNRH